MNMSGNASETKSLQSDRLRRTLGLALAGLAVASCGAVAPESTSRLNDLVQKADCRNHAARPDPLIVDWPTSVRSDLEMMRGQGLVAVRWQDCEFEILKRCTLPGSYKYLAITPKHDSVKIADQAGLEANLPFFGAKFEGELSRKGQLNAEMDIVGTYRAETPGIRSEDLQGDCALATHVITTMDVGAFEFFSGQEHSESLGVKVPIVDIGGSGHSSDSKEILQRDGDRTKCAEGDATAAPPVACGATLRVELRTLNQTHTPGQSTTNRPRYRRGTPATP